MGLTCQSRGWGARRRPGPSPAWPHSGKQCPLGGRAPPIPLCQADVGSSGALHSDRVPRCSPKEQITQRERRGQGQRTEWRGSYGGEGGRAGTGPWHQAVSPLSGSARSSQLGPGSGGWTYHGASTLADRQQCPGPRGNVQMPTQEDASFQSWTGGQAPVGIHRSVIDNPVPPPSINLHLEC